MNIQTLSRQEKRARIAKAAKLYGIKGPESLALFEAYNALARGDVAGAAQMAFPVTQSHPANPHAWIVLGGAALAKREGATAKAFFAKAAETAPRDAIVLGGLSKAHVLLAEVEDAVRVMGEAIGAGSTDKGLIALYLQMMALMGRRLVAVDVAADAVRRSDDAALSLALADILVETDETGRAIEWLERAYRLDPAPEAHRIARLRAMLYSVRLDETEALARDLLEEVEDRDTVALILLTVLRVQRRLDAAMDLADAFEFATPEGFAQARGIVANIEQDRGNTPAATEAYTEALHIAPGTEPVGKAFGVFLFRQGDFASGQPHFDTRFPAAQRKLIALNHADPAMLAKRDRLFVMTEQGIGDQLALMTLLRIAPIAEGCDLTFVGDGRHGALLAGNTLGLGHAEQGAFAKTIQGFRPEEMIYLGDLTRYLPDQPASARHGAFLVADPARRVHLRKKYETQAEGRPIVGVAWGSRSLIGLLRSIELVRLVETLPEGALVVNLQYGDTKADIAAASKRRPDLKFLTDPEVDQMRDLAGFVAQISALDRVVTIDNTTAHVAGALGHGDTHVLLPGGSECMWYWGEAGTNDPWYGVLHLHRQKSVNDWSAPLGEIAALG